MRDSVPLLGHSTSSRCGRRSPGHHLLQDSCVPRAWEGQADARSSWGALCALSQHVVDPARGGRGRGRGRVGRGFGWTGEPGGGWRAGCGRGRVTCVFCVGICSRSARALASKVSSKAISAPWTPLSRRLLAYSLRPIDRIQRITRSLLQTSTSADRCKHGSRRHRKLFSRVCPATQDRDAPAGPKPPAPDTRREPQGPGAWPGGRTEGFCHARALLSWPVACPVETVLLKLTLTRPGGKELTTHTEFLGNKKRRGPRLQKPKGHTRI